MSEKKQFHAVSLSGGKDSTAMLLLMIERGMPIDLVLSADTGMEFPEMYAHLAKVDDFLYRERGLHITTLRNPHSFEWFMFEVPTVKQSAIERRIAYGQPLKGYGWPGMKVRWCTGKLKTHLINKEVNRLKGEHNALHYVGIAADEAGRCKGEIYPLVAWGITEADALKICYSREVNPYRITIIPQRIRRNTFLNGKTSPDNSFPLEDGFIFFGNKKIPFHIDWNPTKNRRLFVQDIISGACIPTPEFAEYNDEPILAYIVNIGMLGEGRVKGEWLPFPATPETLKATLKSIGIDNGRYKRFMVAQYFTDIAGLDALLPSLPCLNELNILAYLLADLECEEVDILEAALEFTKASELSEIINLVLNLSLFEYIPDVSDDEELGRYCVETFDFCDVPGIDEFLKHIDYTFYGISKRHDEDGAFVEGGYIGDLTDIPTLYSGLYDFSESIRPFDGCPDCSMCSS